MSKGSYFIIGGGILQQDFVKAVQRMGFETHVFDYNPNAPCAKISDVFHCISIDEKDKILDVAKIVSPIAIQTAATEMGNISACYVGEKMNLCTNSYKTALDTTDKSRMKKIFKEKEIPSAKYFEASKIEDVPLSYLKYPLVVKASDRSAGRGVTRVNNISEFKEHFEYALKQSNNKKVIVEEYLKGRQYSVETISSRGKHYVVAITEETFDGTDNLIETRHMLPANIPSNLSDIISIIAIRTLSAFNVQYGAGHIELRVTDEGPKVIEVASRSGGLRDFMIQKAYGCDYNRLLINASLGQEVQVKHLYQKYVVSVFIVTESDYQLYNKMKVKNPQSIIRENINKVDLSNKPKNLMDSQGFFYLLFDNFRDAESVLRDI